MLVLKTSDDYICFLQVGGNNLVSQWLDMFFYGEINLSADEEVKVYSIALEWFKFHTIAMAKYEKILLSSCDCNEQIKSYIDAICTIFEYFVGEVHANMSEWQRIYRKAVDVAQCILDNFDVKNALLDTIQFRLLPLPPTEKKIAEKSEKKKMKKYLHETVASATRKRLQKQCPFTTNDEPLRSISPLFELFLQNCDHDKKIKKINVNLANIVVCCWFLRFCGYKLPQIVDKNVNLCMLRLLGLGVDGDGDGDAVIECKLQLKNLSICWIAFCVLCTNEILSHRGRALLDPLNGKVFVAMAESVLDAVVDVDDGCLAHAFKKKTLQKYLPVRFEMCVDALNANGKKERKERMNRIKSKK